MVDSRRVIDNRWVIGRRIPLFGLHSKRIVGLASNAVRLSTSISRSFLVPTTSYNQFIKFMLVPWGKGAEGVDRSLEGARDESLESTDTVSVGEDRLTLSAGAHTVVGDKLALGTDGSEDCWT